MTVHSPSLTFMKHEGWFHYEDRGVSVKVCAVSGACQMKFIYARWLNGYVVTAYVASNLSVICNPVSNGLAQFWLWDTMQLEKCIT